MSRLIVFLIVAVCFFILLKRQKMWFLNQPRRKGLYPSSDKQPTLFDVRSLLRKGEKELAIDVYCQIFKTTRIQASKAVNELEKSVKGKDLEIE